MGCEPIALSNVALHFGMASRDGLCVRSVRPSHADSGVHAIISLRQGKYF